MRGPGYVRPQSGGQQGRGEGEEEGVALVIPPAQPAVVPPQLEGVDEVRPVLVTRPPPPPSPPHISNVVLLLHEVVISYGGQEEELVAPGQLNIDTVGPRDPGGAHHLDHLGEV